MDPLRTVFKQGDQLGAAWCNEVARRLLELPDPGDNAAADGGAGLSAGEAGRAAPDNAAPLSARHVPVWTRQTGPAASLFYVGTNPVYDKGGAIEKATGITITPEGWAKINIPPGPAWLVVEDDNGDKRWDIRKDPPPPPSGSGSDPETPPFALQLHDGVRQMCFSPVCVPGEGDTRKRRWEPLAGPSAGNIYFYAPLSWMMCVDGKGASIEAHSSAAPGLGPEYEDYRECLGWKGGKVWVVLGVDQSSPGGSGRLMWYFANEPLSEHAVLIYDPAENVADKKYQAWDDVCVFRAPHCMWDCLPGMPSDPPAIYIWVPGDTSNCVLYGYAHGCSAEGTVSAGEWNKMEPYERAYVEMQEAKIDGEVMPTWKLSCKAQPDLKPPKHFLVASRSGNGFISRQSAGPFAVVSGFKPDLVDKCPGLFMEEEQDEDCIRLVKFAIDISDEPATPAKLGLGDTFPQGGDMAEWDCGWSRGKYILPDCDDLLNCQGIDDIRQRINNLDNWIFGGYLCYDVIGCFLSELYYGNLCHEIMSRCGLEYRLDELENRLSALENRMEVVEERLDTVESELEILKGDLEAVEGRLETVERAIMVIDSWMENVQGWLSGLYTAVKDIPGFDPPAGWNPTPP